VKLNFDRNFKENIFMDGYGSIIINWMHTMLWIYAADCGIGTNNEVEFLTLERGLNLEVLVRYSKLQLGGVSQLVIIISKNLVQGALVEKLSRS